MLRSLILKPCSLERYSEINKGWYRTEVRAREGDSVGRAEIMVTIETADYESLMREFLEEPTADKVSVNESGTWRRYLVRRMTQEEVSHICRVASNDRIRRGHIELYFDTRTRRSTMGLLKLKFAETSKGLICYETNFPHWQAKLVKWQDDKVPQGKLFRGLLSKKALA